MSPVQTHRQTPDPDIPARARRASSARPGERGEEAGWWEGGAREGGDHKRCEAADPTHTPFTWLALVSEGRAGMERVAAPSSSLWRSWARARRLARRYPLRPRLWADDRVCWRAGGAASRQAHQRVCRRAACTRAARERGESLRSGDGRAGGRAWVVMGPGLSGACAFDFAQASGWVSQRPACVHWGMVAQSCDDPPRTRTWNLRLRRPTPYPLGQQANWMMRRSVCCSLIALSQNFLLGVGSRSMHGLFMGQPGKSRPALWVESAAGRPGGRGPAASRPFSSDLGHASMSEWCVVRECV